MPDGSTLIKGTRFSSITALRLTCPVGQGEQGISSPTHIQMPTDTGVPAPREIGEVVHLDLDLESSRQYLRGYPDAEESYALVLRDGDRVRKFRVEDLEAALDIADAIEKQGLRNA